MVGNEKDQSQISHSSVKSYQNTCGFKKRKNKKKKKRITKKGTKTTIEAKKKMEKTRRRTRIHIINQNPPKNALIPSFIDWIDRLTVICLFDLLINYFVN